MDNGGIVISPWRDHALSLLRIMAGFLFISHGLQKMLGVPSPLPMHIDSGSMLWWSGLIELVGGGLFILGLFTRPVAFLLCGEMAVAYFKQHAPGGFWPLENKGELAVLYCFVFLYFVFAGAGTWSLDSLLFRRRTLEVGPEL